MTDPTLQTLSQAKAPDSHAARIIHAKLVESGESEAVTSALEQYIGCAEEAEQTKALAKDSTKAAKEVWKRVVAAASARSGGCPEAVDPE